MGMAASQARLLSLTSRLHDIELKAQNIESNKIALATQKDEVYQAYCDALDATSIKVAYRDGVFNTNYVDANFSTLCNYDEGRMKSYALRDNKSGKLIVSEQVSEMYESYGNDKYSFAWAMIGFEGCFGWGNNAEMGFSVGIGGNNENDDPVYGYDMSVTYGTPATDGNAGDLYMTECEADVYNAHKDEDDKLATLFDNIEYANTTQEKTEALETFRDYLYDNYSNEIFDKMNINKNGEGKDSENPELEYEDKLWGDVKAEFNYWVHMFEAIENAGGCQAIDPQYESGDAGNQWLNNMVAAGQVIIMVYDDTGHKNEWSDTSVATSTNSNYLQDMQNEKEQKKAEAKYQHELDLINRKDTKFDTELSKLETERSALKTEMDSIKTVRDDNVDRTFGIFS